MDRICKCRREDEVKFCLSAPRKVPLSVILEDQDCNWISDSPRDICIDTPSEIDGWTWKLIDLRVEDWQSLVCLLGSGYYVRGRNPKD